MRTQHCVSRSGAWKTVKRLTSSDWAYFSCAVDLNELSAILNAQREVEPEHGHPKEDTALLT